MTAALHRHPDGTLLDVKIVPGSSRTVIGGAYEDRLKIRVAAPPEKGKANQCLCVFLAKRLGLRKQAVAVIGGHTHPAKRLLIVGLEPAEVAARLGLD